MIHWVSNKRQLANDKHFNGMLTGPQLDLLVSKIITNPSYKGCSDRCNGNYEPAKILWGDYAGKTYAVVLDAAAVRKNKVLVVSFYDIKESTKVMKAKRFNMVKV